MEDRLSLLRRSIAALCPFNEQEETDQRIMLAVLEREGERCLTRQDKTAHFTASAWVVSPDRSKVLMAYHNLYHSWSWLGGHADGEADLRQTALREVWEESGLERVRLLSPDIYSLEVLTVDGHEKRGRYVSSHLHLNVTYLLEADPAAPIRVKADENSQVGWFLREEAVEASSEPWFRARIYRKLNDKLSLFQTRRGDGSEDGQTDQASRQR